MATILDIAQGDSNFGILVAAIGFIDSEKGTDYASTLDDAGQSLTVFAPTNAAFGQLAADLGFAGDPADTAAVTTFLTGLGADTLETVVTYHVAAGELLAADIGGLDSVSTLQGGAIGVGELPVLNDLEPDIIDPSLILTDQLADNGVVHVIDRVLLPIDLPGNDVPTVTGIVLQSGSGFDENPGDFDMLREAVVAAGLDGALNDPDADLTVFAPTDGAFVALSQALGYDGADEEGAFGHLVEALKLLNGGGDPIELLSDVLLFHAAGQSLQASQVTAAGEVETLQGGKITLDGAALEDADPDLPDPELVATDIQASNGVVHVIDGVLSPVDLPPLDGTGKVDFEVGSDAAEHFSTGRGNDLVNAAGGNDKVAAGNGRDLVLGGSGRDFLFGNNGRDTVDGGEGNDRIFGGKGKDLLSGGEGRDQIFGGFGKDTIDGGQGNDWLAGGGGKDTFVFEEGDGRDVILGFRSGKDQIDLSSFGFESFEQVQDHISAGVLRTEINLEGTEITLLGLGQKNLGEDDFILG